jgi:hypothetical protein
MAAARSGHSCRGGASGANLDGMAAVVDVVGASGLARFRPGAAPAGWR